MALLSLPFWLALPYLMKPERLDAVFGGGVALGKLALMAALALVASYAFSACVEWDSRRKSRRSR